jgi:hypothetical protein
MTQSAADATARDQIFIGLTPFFLDAAQGDAVKARAAAEAMVAGFDPKTMEETLLAAQIIVYSLAGMDSLRRSAAAPDLPERTHLRLRGNANAMQRASQQARKALEMRRKAAASPKAAAPGAPVTPAERTFTEADLNAAIKQASAIIAEARAAAAPPPAKTLTYWEAKREQQRQDRLAKRAMIAERAANQMVPNQKTAAPAASAA